MLAIVITLLVLDLRPPHGQLLSGLLQQWPTYLAYAASYLYVAVVWLNHKAAFVRIRTMDRSLHWANLGTLATAALLPFPTAVVADALENGDRTDARVAVALYALVGALLSASWWVFSTTWPSTPNSPNSTSMTRSSAVNAAEPRPACFFTRWAVRSGLSSCPRSAWRSSSSCRSTTALPATAWPRLPAWSVASPQVVRECSAPPELNSRAVQPSWDSTAVEFGSRRVRQAR